MPISTVLRNDVDGVFVETPQRFNKPSPVDGALVAVVCEADRALVDRAVEAAGCAVHGPRRRLAMADRAALLHEIAAGIGGTKLSGIGREGVRSLAFYSELTNVCVKL